MGDQIHRKWVTKFISEWVTKFILDKWTFEQVYAQAKAGRLAPSGLRLPHGGAV